MEHGEVTAHRLLGYALIVNPNQPDIVIIQFKTKAGPLHFVATRKILEQLAGAFQAQASNMPVKFEDDSFQF
jgi:hypothetical protein